VTRPARVLVGPGTPRATMLAAVHDGGGTVVTDAADADALVWLHPSDPDGLRDVLRAGPGIRWVQLPFAGVEPYLPLVRDPALRGSGEDDAEERAGGIAAEGRVWTCGKGVYAEPVAEMALGMLIAGLRELTTYARRTSWSRGVGTNLLDARVTIVGGGEIARALIGLLGPFRCEVTVVRRRLEPVPGAARVLPLTELVAAVRDADAVVLALALTPETRGIVGREVLAAMAPHAWLVNVARGAHVDTDALVTALAEGRIGGAALDVTDPEPLPDGHPLWHEPRCLITPHTGNTPEMGVPLLEARVRTNVARFVAGEPLVGPVDAAAGY
jgi:phosphoglycerate dehydrogenase-like enzyme